MNENIDKQQNEPAEPRPAFLAAAAVAVVLAAVAYIYEDAIVSGSGGQLTFAAILIVLVLSAMVLVLCYRNPALGNRLLGADKALNKPQKGVKSDVQYSGGFKAESGADTKRLNTKRKQARYSRQKLAKVTRKMQQEQAAQSPDAED